jgi:hypothetical protein
MKKRAAPKKKAKTRWAEKKIKPDQKVQVMRGWRKQAKG